VITLASVGGKMACVRDHLELQRLADLSDEELAEAYAPPGEPWLRVNFVSTVDGAAQGPDGLSGSINNPADKRVFDALRRRADCLVVGAGTLRAEEYDVPQVPLVVVSRSGDVPPTLRGAPRGRVLMATVGSSNGLAAAREALGEDNVLVLGDDEIDLTRLKDELAARGWTEQLCEGGPSLFADLLAADVVDELCWTVVPVLTGGDAVRMTTGAEVDVTLRPVLLLEQDGTLLGRWLVEGTGRPD
jgi:riboflavin biosynthesis pyrimidine reductase